MQSEIKNMQGVNSETSKILNKWLKMVPDEAKIYNKVVCVVIENNSVTKPVLHTVSATC